MACEANGLVEGRDYIFEVRFSGGRYEKFPEMARELAQAGVQGDPRQYDRLGAGSASLVPPIPVVMMSINDPVGTGLIASLARPGGHTTGVCNACGRLDTEADRVPARNPAKGSFDRRTLIILQTRQAKPSSRGLRERAGALGMTVTAIEVRSRDDLEAAFAAMPAHRPDLLQVISDSGLLDLSDRIAALALINRLPTFATNPDFARFGGLWGYGASREALYLRSTYFVNKSWTEPVPLIFPWSSRRKSNCGSI